MAACYSAETEAGPVPAHLPARPRGVRRQEGLRRGRLRRLHGMARRRAVPFLPGAGLPRRRAARSPPSRACPRTAAASDPTGLPRRPGLPVRLLRRRHDDDHGLRRLRRASKGRSAACAEGQYLPLHRLSLDRRRAARQDQHRGGRRRQRARRQHSQPAHRRDPDRPCALHHGHRNGRHAAPQGAALAARPCAPQVDRQEQGARHSRRGRGLYLGGRAAPALQHRAARGPSGRSRRHLYARQRRALRRPAPGGGGRRERGGGRGRHAGGRHRLRDPAGGVRSVCGDGARRALAARQGRGHPERQPVLHPAGRDR